MRRVGLGTLVAAMLVLLTAATAQAVTYQVTTTADSSAGDANCTASACTLRQAINAADAAGAGIVNVPAGIYTLTAGALRIINANLTLAGAGAGAGGTVIDGDGKTGVLYVTGVRVGSVANLRLSGVTITGGWDTAGGGILVNLQSTVALTDDVLTANTANTGQGARSMSPLGATRSASPVRP